MIQTLFNGVPKFRKQEIEAVLEKKGECMGELEGRGYLSEFDFFSLENREI